MRRIEFDDAARLGILRGADLLADLVALTLGPAARTVLIGRAYAQPVITVSGYAVAQEIELPDPLEQVGVQALRELAWRTSDAVGDGTASAMVSARAVLHGAVGAARMGIDPAALEAGCARALAAVLARLEAAAVPIGSDGPALEQLAAAAAGGDAAIAGLVASTLREVGTEGAVLVEAGHGTGDAVEVQQGMRLDQGFVSAAFATDREGLAAELDDPYLLLTTARVTELSAIVPALNAFAASGKPLVLVAGEVAGEALATLVANRRRADFKVAAVKAPGVGEWRRAMLEDLAVATGGVPVADELGSSLERLRPEMLGRARRVRITATSTTVIGGAGRPEEVASRCRQLRQAIARERHLSLDRERLEQRLARLVSGVAVLRLGGATESAIAARREQARSAVHAARAALLHGVVPGGGSALLHAGRALAELAPRDLAERAAFSIIRAALAAPARAIAANRGRDGAAMVAAVLAADDGLTGYDAAADRLADMVAAGILDPLAVARTALRNAVSTGCRLGAVSAAVTGA